MFHCKLKSSCIYISGTGDFQQCGMCDQQSLRSACAYAQSDQRLYQSLEYSMSVKLLTKQHLEFLSLKGGCTGLSECTVVKMSHCWKISYVSTRENLSSEACEQQRCRPACACVQSDQHLCFSLFGKYHIQTCNKRNFYYLASLCS